MSETIIEKLKNISKSVSPEVKEAISQVISELEILQIRSQKAASVALSDALCVIDDLRVRAATDFKNPNCQGQRGSDRCDALYDAYSAVNNLTKSLLPVSKISQEDDSVCDTGSLHANRECYAVRIAVPDDDRIVILFDVFSGRTVAVAARYRDGRWFGTFTGDNLLIESSIDQYDYHWCEFPIKCDSTIASSGAGNIDKRTNGTIPSPYLK